MILDYVDTPKEKCFIPEQMLRTENNNVVLYSPTTYRLIQLILLP